MAISIDNMAVNQLPQASYGRSAPATTSGTMENLVNVGANQRWYTTNYIVQHISLHDYLVAKPQLTKIIEDDKNTMLSVFRKQGKYLFVFFCIFIFVLGVLLITHKKLIG